MYIYIYTTMYDTYPFCNVSHSISPFHPPLIPTCEECDGHQEPADGNGATGAGLPSTMKGRGGPKLWVNGIGGSMNKFIG
jgi:hypothetical protein